MRRKSDDRVLYRLLLRVRRAGEGRQIFPALQLLHADGGAGGGETRTDVSDREPGRYAGDAGADIQEKFRTGVSRQDKPETPDERGLELRALVEQEPTDQVPAVFPREVIEETAWLGDLVKRVERIARNVVVEVVPLFQREEIEDQPDVAEAERQRHD